MLQKAKYGAHELSFIGSDRNAHRTTCVVFGFTPADFTQDINNDEECRTKDVSGDRKVKVLSIHPLSVEFYRGLAFIMDVLARNQVQSTPSLFPENGWFNIQTIPAKPGTYYITYPFQSLLMQYSRVSDSQYFSVKVFQVRIIQRHCWLVKSIYVFCFFVTDLCNRFWYFFPCLYYGDCTNLYLVPVYDASAHFLPGRQFKTDFLVDPTDDPVFSEPIPGGSLLAVHCAVTVKDSYLNFNLQGIQVLAMPFSGESESS